MSAWRPWPERSLQPAKTPSAISNGTPTPIPTPKPVFALELRPVLLLGSTDVVGLDAAGIADVVTGPAVDDDEEEMVAVVDIVVVVDDDDDNAAVRLNCLLPKVGAVSPGLYTRKKNVLFDILYLLVTGNQV